MKRTFLAIEIELSNRLSDIYNTFLNQLANENIKWVKPSHTHMTLFFLGDTQENDISKIADLLKNSLKDFNQFELQIAGCGVFPNLNHPSVLWFGIKQCDQLTRLKNIIDSTLSAHGFPVEKRKFHPHLTIGRIKEIKRSDILKKLISSYKEEILSEQIISELVFFESRLTSAGPVYSRIIEFRFR